MDVQASIKVVIICHLRKVHDSLVGLLQAWDGDGHVTCRCEILPILVLEILVLDVE